MSSFGLCLANASLTVPFGISAFLFPAFTFGQFGLENMAESTLALIRGYASAALGYGLIMMMLANKIANVEREMLIASLVFNGCETVLQLHATALLHKENGFNNMIWTTIIGHGVLTLWTVKNLLFYNTEKKKSKD